MHMYLIRKRSNVIFEIEGSRFLVKIRMIDSRLVDVPEELVDALLLNQICLIGSAGGHLRGMGKAHRRQEQCNRFHSGNCFAKDRPTSFASCFIYQSFMQCHVREVWKVWG